MAGCSRLAVFPFIQASAAANPANVGNFLSPRGGKILISLAQPGVTLDVPSA
jgi:hypothetical protein